MEASKIVKDMKQLSIEEDKGAWRYAPAGRVTYTLGAALAMGQ